MGSWYKRWTAHEVYLHRTHTHDVLPYVYYHEGPSNVTWLEERDKVRWMLHSNGGTFKINGRAVNSASHATYSQALRNNDLWCGVLQEVGWHLQEIMGDGLHIYTREGMNLFVENVHIHREYFTNQDN